MVKPGAKRKRTREEMKQAAVVEAQLKGDKNAFLNEVQRMEHKAQQQELSIQSMGQ